MYVPILILAHLVHVHRLIRKLNELCSCITPLVVDCSRRMRSLLAPPRTQMRRFESQNDIAAAVMDEMLGLEDAVMSNLWSEPAIGVGHRHSPPRGAPANNSSKTGASASPAPASSVTPSGGSGSALMASVQSKQSIAACPASSGSSTAPASMPSTASRSRSGVEWMSVLVVDTRSSVTIKGSEGS